MRCIVLLGASVEKEKDRINSGSKRRLSRDLDSQAFLILLWMVRFQPV